MNLGEFKSFIRQNISDPHGNILSDQELLIYLNLSYRKIQDMFMQAGIHHNVKTLTATFTANTREVEIGGAGATTVTSPPNIRKIIKVEDSDGWHIPLMNLEQARQSTKPAMYWIHTTDDQGREIISLGYYLKPGSALSIIVSYIPRLVSFDSFSDPSLTDFSILEDCHDLIAFYASMIILARDKDIGTYQVWERLYKDELESKLSTGSLKNRNDQGVVDVTYGGDID